MFVTSFTTKGSTELLFASCFEKRVAAAVVDAVTEAAGDSVGGVASDAGVGSFDVWLFFASSFEEHVATAVDDASDEAAGASVGSVDSATGVGSFAVGVTSAGAGFLDVDDDAAVSAGAFLLDPFSFRCSCRLTVFIFVEVEAITKICEPNCSRKRMLDDSTSQPMSEIYSFFPLQS